MKVDVRFDARTYSPRFMVIDAYDEPLSTVIFALHLGNRNCDPLLSIDVSVRLRPWLLWVLERTAWRRG